MSCFSSASRRSTREENAMKLKGSKTHDNLKAAFAGESQANRRYLYFASKADVEGQNDVAALFRSTAEGETGHAHGHLDYLAVEGDPATCQLVRAVKISPRQWPVRRTNTRTCTPAWRNPRATRVSTKLPIGSRRWPRPSARTPIVSKERSTDWPTSAASRAMGRLCRCRPIAVACRSVFPDRQTSYINKSYRHRAPLR